MRPFRSRVAAAIVLAVLMFGLLGTVANAGEIPAVSFPEDPWGVPTILFPEDPWPGQTF